jgi:crotonobetaine/carnitine-CoA ligase
MTFAVLLARQAARNGDKPYLLFEDAVYSYRELEQETCRLANGLLEFGIRKGDHVAILIGNCPHTLFLNFALGYIGAVVCPINTAAKGELLTYFLNQADCTALLLGAESVARFDEVAQRSPQLRHIVLVDEPGSPCAMPAVMPTAAHAATAPRVIHYDTLRSQPDRPPPVQVSPRDRQGIFYTSGTTGPSKGVVTSFEQNLAYCAGRAEYLGMQRDDVIYTCLPLFHGNALNAAAIPAFLADCSLALSRRFSARTFWTDVRRHGVTQFNLLSSMTNILWGQPPGPEDQQHKVRLCNMVPVPSFAPEFARRFGIAIASSYSLTDFGQGTFLQPGYPSEKFRSAGKPRPGIELSIVDDDDRALPAGEAGEICLRPTVAALGHRYYYKMDAVNAEANRDGWFHTGDRGYLDTDGFLYFVDRKKDAIRRRGENISSWEVEQVLARHPAVAEAAVFPVRGEMSEDEVMASIVCHAGVVADPVALIRHCEKNMSYFMVPRFVEFVADLPRTATEKVQKSVLRESAERRLDQLWDREKAGIVLTR